MINAAWHGKRDMVKRLLKQKADIRYQETLHIITPSILPVIASFIAVVFALFRLT